MSTISTQDLALVITDPQNDFLSPEGVTWGVVGESVTRNHTVENIETLFKTVIEQGFEVHIASDATAGAITPELGDGYASAVTNFGFIANGVLSTEDAASAIAGI